MNENLNWLRKDIICLYEKLNEEPIDLKEKLELLKFNVSVLKDSEILNDDMEFYVVNKIEIMSFNRIKTTPISKPDGIFRDENGNLINLQYRVLFSQILNAEAVNIDSPFYSIGHQISKISIEKRIISKKNVLKDIVINNDIDDIIIIMKILDIKNMEQLVDNVVNYFPLCTEEEINSFMDRNIIDNYMSLNPRYISKKIIFNNSQSFK